LLYAATLFNGRTTVSSDNRLRVTTLETIQAGRGVISAPVFPVAGLSALDDSPLDGALESNPALVDGNLTTSAGVNIGLQPTGDPARPRNVGLDFGTPVEVNNLLVWVDRELPQDIANAFSWEVYTSGDNPSTGNPTWTLHQTVSSAPFGPFLNRFEINFNTVKTRSIKVVTRPLSASVLDASKFPSILVTEIQAFLNTPAQALKRRTTRTSQNYSLDVKTRLMTLPSLYHDLNAFYAEVDPGGEQRYNISNGIFFTHRFTSMLSSSANASVEYGTEGKETRAAVLYYASLLANPLKTLSNSLVFSGNYQDVGGTASRLNSVVLYNNAQLYRGLDGTLNVGAIFTSQDQATGGSATRTDAYINLGAGINPRPDMAITLSYLGKRSYLSGGEQGRASGGIEHRLDAGASYNPFRTLFLSASVNVAAEPGQKTRVQQGYGLNWAPFPDGNLHFFLNYNESYSPGRSRLVQPTVRWYPGAKRRSSLEVTYQMADTELGGQKTQSHSVSTTLRLDF
jgi:hypothetical protein